LTEPTTGPLRWLGESLYVAIQRALPQHALSRGVRTLTRLHAGPLTRLGVRAFVGAFDVDLSDAESAPPAGYPNFNAFFTRALKPGARPLDARPSTLLSPVDGTLSQLGRIRAGEMMQAKGQVFDLTSLLGGDTTLAAPFEHGSFATLYLSPRDYHRVHMPLDGELTRCIHVPGRLFSVNATTASRVPRLYAHNERVVCLFDTEAGPMALVLVGAIFVGSIELTWHGEVTPPRGRRCHEIPLPTPAPRLQRGAELGRFNMGSTVILALPGDRLDWASDLKPGASVRMGQGLGRLPVQEPA
jgi:phosphatidylserine decarboxylase